MSVSLHSVAVDPSRPRIYHRDKLISNFLFGTGAPKLLRVMITLGLDQSTFRCRAALLEGDTVLGTCAWEESRRHNQQGAIRLRDLMRENGIEPAAIQIYAVGLGPGTFSGLRVSLATAKAMAMPGRSAVVGIPSAEVIAETIRGVVDPDRPVLVVGDARRKRLWVGRFEAHGAITDPQSCCSLLPADQLGARLRPPLVMGSPDWDTIGSLLEDTATEGIDLVRETCTPDAVTLARMAIARSGAAASAEPAPIYLHPPVFVKPRFPRN